MRRLRSTPQCLTRCFFPWVGFLPLCQWSWVLAAFATVGAAAHAQHHGHADVEFQYVGSRVQLNRSIYTHVFPQSGISRQYTTNPGFASESDVGGGVGPHDTIFYHVLDPLLFWNGSDFAEPAAETQIRIQNNPPSVPDTIVSRQAGKQEGSLDPPRNRIASALPSGDFHSHVSFQLEPYHATPPPPPEFGAYGIKLSVATSAEGIEPSDPVFLVFNFGLDEAIFEEGIDAFDRLLEGHGVLGDYDENGELDAGDLDLQATAIAGKTDPLEYDLNGDRRVEFDDRQVWIHELKHTWFGNANLDLEFNSSDMVQVFAAGKYETGQHAGWAEGDWDANLKFNSSDMVTAFADGGYEKGPRIDTVAVPEPASAILFLVSLVVMTTRRRRFDP